MAVRNNSQLMDMSNTQGENALGALAPAGVRSFAAQLVFTCDEQQQRRGLHLPLTLKDKAPS